MIEGEIYQLTKNGIVDLSEDEHFDIIRRKTAYLFAGMRRASAACWVPARHASSRMRCGTTA